MSEKKVELNIYQKLNNFAASVEAIKKDKKGYNYKYADINAVLDVIRPRLSENGLVIIQNLKKEETGYNLNTKLINIDNPDEFLEIVLGNGLKKDDFAEFTGFMKGHKGIDLTNESEKMKLIANIPLLKEFIKEFKEYANKQ